MPGPIAAFAGSTGAMLPRWRSLSALGSSRLRALRKSRRLVGAASTGRGRQTRTIEEARALVPLARGRLLISLRIGQVPVIEKLERSSPSNIVSQPVETLDTAPPI